MNLCGFDPVTVWLLSVKDLEVAIPSRAVQHLPCRFQSIVLRIVLFRLKPFHWRTGVFVPGVQFPFHGGHSDGAASLPKTREKAILLLRQPPASRMVEYINKLSSSIHQQSKTGNFGVGAKISAAPANPEGLLYLSWVGGKGSMIHLCREGGVYGLRRFLNGEFWQGVSDDIKPEPIKDHGTMVVLLGENESQDTMRNPPRAKMPRKWVLRYLNERFFRFPPE